jgi:hypothetical protein
MGRRVWENKKRYSKFIRKGRKASLYVLPCYGMKLWLWEEVINI